MSQPSTTPDAEEPQLFASFSRDSDQQRNAKAALAKLRDASTPEVAEVIDKVMNGKSSIRELMSEPGMRDIMARTAQTMRSEIAAMTPEEREKFERRLRP